MASLKIKDILVILLIHLLHVQVKANPKNMFRSPDLSSAHSTFGLASINYASSCAVNHWCRPPPQSPNSDFEYLFAERLLGLTWFEALELCREEPGRASLLSIDSLTEIGWLVEQLHVISTSINQSKSVEEQRWYVNAHRYLYNMKGPAWASGRLVEFDLPQRRRVTPKACFRHQTQFLAQGECFAVARNSSGTELVDVNCTEIEASRVICKRAINGAVVVHNCTQSEEKFQFVKSDWIQSPFDSLVVYKFVTIEPNCGKSNFYCAKLICNRFDAELSDLESFQVLHSYRCLIMQYS